MEKEILTFVVPAYNAASTINRTIDSILTQNCDRYKIIIINDGSTDSTDEIGKNYAKKYPEKIKYIYQNNRGLGGARNHGIDLADTPYIVFLDSDDWLMPGYVEKVVQQIINNIEDTPQIILTLPQVYNENSKLIDDWYDKELFQTLFKKDGDLVNPQQDKMIYQTDVNQCRKILQVEFIKKIKFKFRERVKWEDVYPHFYLLSHCRKCMGIGSTGFYYRKGNLGQITETRGKDRLDLIIVINDLLKYVFKVEQGKKMLQMMKYPMMKIMVSFANEGIRMADMDTRRELVNELHKTFKQIPASFYRELKREGKKYCSNSEMRQYKLFMGIIKRKILIRLFYDYFYRDASEILVKRFIKLKR